MILFADSQTGKLLGKIDGRVHGKEHKNIWIGDKKKSFRVVIQYEQSEPVEKEIEQNIKIGQELDKDGFYQPIYKTIKKKIITSEFKPNVSDDQIQFVKELEDGANQDNYRIDIKSKKLVKMVV